MQTFDFFDIKGAVEALFLSLGITDIVWKKKDLASYLKPDAAARILLGDNHLGDLGEVHPNILEGFDLRGEVYLFDLDFHLLIDKTVSIKRFKPLPKFPAVNRDLAIIVHDSVAAQDMLEYLEQHRPQYAESFILFDQYRGEQLGKDKKSLAFRITYRSSERSLTDLEVNEIHKDFSRKVVAAFQAELRP